MPSLRELRRRQRDCSPSAAIRRFGRATLFASGAAGDAAASDRRRDRAERPAAPQATIGAARRERCSASCALILDTRATYGDGGDATATCCASRRALFRRMLENIPRSRSRFTASAGELARMTDAIRRMEDGSRHASLARGAPLGRVRQITGPKRRHAPARGRRGAPSRAPPSGPRCPVRAARDRASPRCDRGGGRWSVFAQSCAR